MATSKPAKIKPATNPTTMQVHLILVFQVDGEQVGQSEMRFEAPRPAPDEGFGMQLPIDARAFVLALEPHVGPTRASHPVVVAAPKRDGIWTPGKPE